MCLSTVFLLYAFWDFTYRVPLKEQGRLWQLDLILDASAALLYFLMWKFSALQFMSAKVFDSDLTGWIGYDMEVQRWTIFTIIIYLLLEPHPLGDRLKGQKRWGF
jgi:hypothetical protein